MKNKIFISIAALVAIAAAWLLLFPGKNPLNILAAKKAAANPGATLKATIDTTNGAFKPTNPANGEPAGYPIYPDIHLFRKDIAAIQATLNDFYGSSLNVDGYFGPKTLAALKAHGFAQADCLSYKDFSDLLALNL